MRRFLPSVMRSRCSIFSLLQNGADKIYLGSRFNSEFLKVATLFAALQCIVDSRSRHIQATNGFILPGLCIAALKQNSPLGFGESK